ncbi:MAG TPA: hypothetical protein PLQ35_17030 [bacterium]|nr:hypothetical protein [bacterium]HQL63983.1 hypothetical protein [bacterium]
MAIYINEEETQQLICIEDAIEAVEGIMRDWAEGKAFNCPRQRPQTPSTLLHVLCAAGERTGAGVFSAIPAGELFSCFLPGEGRGDGAKVAQTFYRGLIT